jgi:hypothetical protein
MSTQIRHVAPALALIFGISFAFFWRQQHPTIPVEPGVSQPTPAADTERANQPPLTLPRVEPAVQSTVAAPPPPAPPPQVGANQPLPPHHAGPPLPVMLNFSLESGRRRPHAGGELGDLSGNIRVVGMVNTSDKPLDLRVIDVNPSTLKRTEASAFLAPGGQRSIGQNSGLGLESGDQITVRSDAFQDLNQIVP